MAFTNAEKLGYVKKVFCDKINSVATLADMVSLIKNISPATVKAFLFANLENLRLANVSNSIRESELATNVEELRTEIDVL